MQELNIITALADYTKERVTEHVKNIEAFKVTPFYSITREILAIVTDLTTVGALTALAIFIL